MHEMTDELPIPPVNADSAPYWEAAAEGKLRMQRCGACGEIRFPPGHICRKCGSARKQGHMHNRSSGGEETQLLRQH